MNAKGKIWAEVTPPDGEYKGLWGGYNVHFSVNGWNYKFESENGVRGMDIPVNILVNDGVVTFEKPNA